MWTTACNKTIISSCITRIYKKRVLEAILYFQHCICTLSSINRWNIGRDWNSKTPVLQCHLAPSPDLLKAFSSQVSAVPLAFEPNSSRRTSPDMDWRKWQALGKLQASCHEYSLHAKVQMNTMGKKLCCSFSYVAPFTFSSHSDWLLQWVYSYSTGNPDWKYVCFLNFPQRVCWTISPKIFLFFSILFIYHKLH